MLEDRRLGREQSPLEEGRRSALADVLLFLDKEGDGLKGPAQCHVPAGAQDLTVSFSFQGFLETARKILWVDSWEVYTYL